MRLFTLLTALLAIPADLSAQNITVQQPVIGRFGVSTTVVVPDRGRAFLGGTKRSLLGRNEAGVPGLRNPLFRNRGFGGVSEASTVTVGAFIHDFEAMDRYVLGQAAAVERAKLSGRAGTAYSRLLSQHQRKSTGMASVPPAEKRKPTVRSPKLAEFYRAQAIKAARRGHNELAKQFEAQARQFGG